MIDFILGVAATLSVLYLYHHFKADPAKAKADLAGLEARLKAAFESAVQRVSAPAVAAAQAEDVAAVHQLATELSPTP